MAEWRRVVPELDRLGLLAKIDRACLTSYADCWGKWTAVAQLLDAEGLLAKGQRGEDRKHPAMQLYRDLGTQLASLGKELGLSPNARGRMHAPDPGDEFDELLDG